METEKGIKRVTEFKKREKKEEEEEMSKYPFNISVLKREDLKEEGPG